MNKNNVLLSLAIILSTGLASAAQINTAGNCVFQAQQAAEEIAKINGHPTSVKVALQGQSDQVETYVDSAGYFLVTTNAGRGENTCIVEIVRYNPQP
jgi:hypothetical protein